MREILRMILVLSIICGVSGLGLATLKDANPPAHRNPRFLRM